MRKIIQRALIGLSFIGGTSCDKNLCKFFSSDCKLEIVNDSWINEREHDSIVLSIVKNQGRLAVRDIYSNGAPFVRAVDSGLYSLRAYNFNEEIVFYRNFDLSDSGIELLVPRRIDLKEVRVYDLNCEEVLNVNVELFAVQY